MKTLLVSILLTSVLSVAGHVNATTAKTSIVESTAGTGEVSTDQVANTEGNSPKKWKTVRIGFPVTGQNGKSAVGRFAISETGKVVTCISDQPSSLGMSQADTVKVTFGDDRLFCFRENPAQTLEQLGKVKASMLSKLTRSSINKKLPTEDTDAGVAATTPVQDYFGDYIDLDSPSMFDYFDAWYQIDFTGMSLDDFACSGFGLQSCPNPPPRPLCSTCWEEFDADRSFAFATGPSLSPYYFVMALKKLWGCLQNCEQ